MAPTSAMARRTLLCAVAAVILVLAAAVPGARAQQGTPLALTINATTIEWVPDPAWGCAIVQVLYSRVLTNCRNSSSYPSDYNLATGAPAPVRTFVVLWTCGPSPTTGDPFSPACDILSIFNPPRVTNTFGTDVGVYYDTTAVAHGMTGNETYTLVALTLQLLNVTTPFPRRSVWAWQCAHNATGTDFVFCASVTTQPAVSWPGATYFTEEAIISMSIDGTSIAVVFGTAPAGAQLSQLYVPGGGPFLYSCDNMALQTLGDGTLNFTGVCVVIQRVHDAIHIFQPDAYPTYFQMTTTVVEGVAILLCDPLFQNGRGRVAINHYDPTILQYRWSYDLVPSSGQALGDLFGSSMSIQAATIFGITGYLLAVAAEGAQALLTFFCVPDTTIGLQCNEVQRITTTSFGDVTSVAGGPDPFNATESYLIAGVSGLNGGLGGLILYECGGGVTCFPNGTIYAINSYAGDGFGSVVGFSGYVLAASSSVNPWHGFVVMAR